MERKRIRLGAAGAVPKKRTKRANPTAAEQRMAELVGREVDARVGPDATFEQRADAAAAVMAEVLGGLYVGKDEDQAEDGARKRR